MDVLSFIRIDEGNDTSSEFLCVRRCKTIYSLKIVENPASYFRIIVINSQCPHGVVT